MKTLKFFVALVLITAVFYSCQKDESESISAIEQDVAVLKTEAVDCNSNCIDPENPVSDQVVVNWGGPNGERFSKTVDITYYNTLEDFVLKVMSTEDIANLLVDEVSVKEFSNPLPAGTWYELSFPLPDEWEVCDDFSFELSVIGNGPQAVFDVEYQLVGECVEEEDDGWPRDTDTEVVDVTNPITGDTWMDRNLGASRAANSSDDEDAYGDLYQWGRAADGHQIRTSGTTTTLSNSNTPGHGNFIVSTSSPDWRSPQNDNLWQGENGINNPCPQGYRLPTAAELEAELASWGSNQNSVGAFTSPLKLPVAGGRDVSDGSLDFVGYYGLYWSSTVDGPRSRALLFSSSYAFTFHDFRAYGYSVRCLKDN